jgi:hypothetical protein
MRALVTGATGFIGRPLLSKLDAPAVLTRDPERARQGLPAADAHAWAPAAPDLLPALAPHLAGRLVQLGHYSFVRARKVGPPHEGRPWSLYRRLPDGVIVYFAGPDGPGKG